MTHNLDDITTQITNILNNDQDYQPVTFDYVSMYVHGMANIKPPYGNDAKFIQNVIDKIPRIPKTFTLEYLSNQLQTNASQGVKGLFSIVNLYPFIITYLNRVEFALAADNICEKFQKGEYHSASRPVSFKQYSVNDVKEIIDTLFRQNIIKYNPIQD